ncbi:IS110 family transposase [Azospirillum sp. sgz301742]
MVKPYDLSKPLVALDHDSTLVAVIEMSGASWLVAALLPGVARRPLQKLPVDEIRLLAQLERWRDEAAASGKPVSRIVVGFEAGRDGLWLARWLTARGIEAYPIHPSSVAVSREARRAKTDRLDTAMLLRGLLGWLRGEPDHCRIVAVPTAAEEDARRPGRERDHLVGERTRVINRLKANLVRLGIRGFNPKLRKAAARLAELRTPEGEPIPAHARAEMERDLERLDLLRRQITAIEQAREEAVQRAPEGANAMVLLLARVRGVGIETADMLVHEVLTRGLRDRRAVARLAGLTGTPDESGGKRRQKGIGKAGVARVRRGMIQLAWRLLQFQRDSALVRWYDARTAGARGVGRKTFLVALARKLLIALTRYATLGELPEGFVLNPA